MNDERTWRPVEPTAQRRLRVWTTPQQGALVVHVVGEVDLNSAPLLGAALEEALGTAGAPPVVVDLTDVEYLSAHGLTALVEARRRALAHRQPLRVVIDETRPVILPLEITGLDEILRLYRTVADALTPRAEIT